MPVTCDNKLPNHTYRRSQSTPTWRFSLISSHSSLVLQSSVGWIFLTPKGFIILPLCERWPAKLEVTAQFRPRSFHFSKLMEACVCDGILVLPLQMWPHVESDFICIVYNQLYYIIFGGVILPWGSVSGWGAWSKLKLCRCGTPPRGDGRRRLSGRCRFAHCCLGLMDACFDFQVHTEQHVGMFPYIHTNERDYMSVWKCCCNPPSPGGKKSALTWRNFDLSVQNVLEMSSDYWRHYFLLTEQGLRHAFSFFFFFYWYILWLVFLLSASRFYTLYFFCLSRES